MGYLKSILILPFFITYCSHSQTSFEKKYLDFHTQWDNGISVTLQDIDSIFIDCPDKTKFPHYFIYKGDLLAIAGFPALGLKYLLLAEKYTNLGYESKKMVDHRAILCFKIGRHYIELKSPLKVQEYIVKGRKVLKEIEDEQPIIQGKYNFRELEIWLKYNFSENKIEAINEFKELYIESKPHRDVLFFIPQRLLLRGAEMALDIDNTPKAEELLALLKKDPKFKKIRDYYLSWYYEVERKYFLKTKKLEKTKKYNDSIYAIKPLNLKKKENIFANYIEIYRAQKKDSLLDIYKDSLQNNLEKQKSKRQESIILLTDENSKYEGFINSLSEKSKKQTYFWIALVLLVLVVFGGILQYIIKKNRKETLQDLQKKQKKKLENITNLSKKHSLTKRECEILLKLIGQKTNKEISKDLCISVATVKFHISNILQKTNVKNRNEIIKQLKE